MDSVKSTLLATASSAFFSGSANEARSLSTESSPLAGLGGTKSLILGLKAGWRVIGNPESGEICL